MTEHVMIERVDMYREWELEKIRLAKSGVVEGESILITPDFVGFVSEIEFRRMYITEWFLDERSSTEEDDLFAYRKDIRYVLRALRRGKYIILNREDRGETVSLLRELSTKPYGSMDGFASGMYSLTEKDFRRMHSFLIHLKAKEEYIEQQREISKQQQGEGQ